MTDPQNGGTTYVYDTLNRLQTLTSPAGTFGFTYDALGRRLTLTRPNAVNTTYTYDAKSELLTALHKKGTSTLDGATYTYDNAGNRKTKQDNRTSTTSTYGYDDIYQLTSATNSTEAYTYDLVGNRQTSTGVPSYTYNSSNQLTAKTGVTYTYDDNGNTKTKVDSTGTTTYGWDFENRLVSVTLPGSGGTVNFKYDPFGRRIQKTASVGSVNAIYVLDGADVLQEVNSTGTTVVARYTMGPGIDHPLAEARGSTTSFYEADGLGSVTSLSKSNGALANSYTYDSFGKQTASTGTVVNPFRYTARELDSETGLMYYRARYYDQNAGRLLSEDQLQFHVGVNFYNYSNNNPVRYRDPSGLSPTAVQEIVTVLAGLGYTQAQIDAAIAYLGGGGSVGGLCASTGVCALIVVDAGLAAFVGYETYKLGVAEGWWGQPKPKTCKKSGDECKKILRDCIQDCSGELRKGEWPFRRCVAKCMEDAGCDYTIPRPFYNPPPR